MLRETKPGVYELTLRLKRVPVDRLTCAGCALADTSECETADCRPYSKVMGKVVYHIFIDPEKGV
jgi:hypothetical protein